MTIIRKIITGCLIVVICVGILCTKNVIAEGEHLFIWFPEATDMQQNPSPFASDSIQNVNAGGCDTVEFYYGVTENPGESTNVSDSITIVDNTIVTVEKEAGNTYHTINFLKAGTTTITYAGSSVTISVIDVGPTYNPVNSYYYKGKEYKVGFAFNNGSNNLSMIEGGIGDSYTDQSTEPFNFDLYLGIMDENGLATNIYNTATINATFSIVNQDTGNLVLTPTAEKVTTNEISTWHANAHSNLGELFSGELKLEYTIIVDQDTTWQGEVNISAQYGISGDVEIDGSSLDTIEKLNDVLASKDNLKDWVNTVDSNINIDDISLLIIKLPANEYAGIIKVDVAPDQDDIDEGSCFNGIKLKGKYDSYTGTLNTTVYGGIQVVGGLEFIENIRFIASNDDKQTYQSNEYPEYYGSKYTDLKIGILGNSELSLNNMFNGYFADVNSVNCCEFQGYDIAILSTDNGYIGSVSSSHFEGNEKDIVIDMPHKQDGATNLSFSYNSFINTTGTAITVYNLPDWINPYNLRFNYNGFFNSYPDYVDFDLEDKEKIYYFMFNAYFVAPEIDQDIYDVVTPRTVVIKGTHSNIVTNPCKRVPGTIYYSIDTTPGLITKIFNGDTENLIDLSNTINKNIEIGIVLPGDSSGIQVAAWEFGGNR